MRSPAFNGVSNACLGHGRPASRLDSERLEHGSHLPRVRFHASAVRGSNPSGFWGARGQRPDSTGDRSAMRRNPSDMVASGKAAAGGPGDKSLAIAKRTRIAKSGLNAQTRGWLRRVSLAHSRLRQIVVRFGQRSIRRRDELASRIEQGDHTLLLDCVCSAIGELQAIHDSISKAMQRTAPTDAVPGSPEKIQVLARRFAAGKSLWIEGDNREQRDGSRE